MGVPALGSISERCHKGLRHATQQYRGCRKHWENEKMTDAVSEGP